MNEKYLPKKVRVLVEDQLGNQKVIEINARWDRIRVNQQSGRRVDTTPKATRAYIPTKLANEGLKIDVNQGTFADNTVNVAQKLDNIKFEEQVQKGINAYYEELNKNSENVDKETEEFETVDETAEAITDEAEKVEDETAETAETAETTETAETAEETTEVIVIEETTIEELTEPTVAGFVLSDEGEDIEDAVEEDLEKAEETTTEVAIENSEGEDDSTSTVVENGNDAEIVNSYEIETVYELSEVELVGNQELIEDKGLQGNLANGVVDPNTANFAVGGDLNFDSALQELANELGDNAVVIIPKLKPVQLTAFGEGLLGAGPGAAHAHTDNRVSNLSGVGPTYTAANNYVIASDSDLVDYANDTSKMIGFDIGK